MSRWRPRTRRRAGRSGGLARVPDSTGMVPCSQGDPPHAPVAGLPGSGYRAGHQRRPPGCEHNPDLHPRTQPRPIRCAEPGRPDVRRMTRVTVDRSDASCDRTRRFRRARVAVTQPRDSGPRNSAPMFLVALQPRALATPQRVLRHRCHMVSSNRSYCKHRLPTVCAHPDDADAGNLMAYGANLADRFGRAAQYVDKSCAARGLRISRSSSRPGSRWS